MPARNTVKIDVEESFYHVYNRGVEKRTIFQDEQDYKVFLKYLKDYLSPPPKREDIIQTFTLKGTSFRGVPYMPNNFFEKIDLIAYCLMPNHFHLLVNQKDKGLMQSLMRSIATKYSMYFNKKYSRVGTLFQGIYKAAMVTGENYLLHLTRYIHLNPSQYSSYGEYLGIRNTTWVKPDLVLSYFSQNKTDSDKLTSYKTFVESQIEDKDMLKGFVLDTP